MKKVLALSLLFLFMACSQNEETFQEIKPKFHLPIGKKISTENLIAEVYFYENSETPKKVKEFNGLSLESDSGKLSLKHKEKIELDPGSYIMRIYLSHNTQGLFWIGEWDIKVKAGKTSEILKPKNTFTNSASVQDKLEGDEHPKIKQYREEKGQATVGTNVKDPFKNESGESNYENVCEAGAGSCFLKDGKTAVAKCNSNGYGYKEKKYCLDENSAGVSCKNGECSYICKKDFENEDGEKKNKCQPKGKPKPGPLQITANKNVNLGEELVVDLKLGSDPAGGGLEITCFSDHSNFTSSKPYKSPKTSGNGELKNIRFKWSKAGKSKISCTAMDVNKAQSDVAFHNLEVFGSKCGAKQCEIDGKCYSENSPNPTNKCEKCDLSDSSDWTQDNKLIPNDNNPCTIDSCERGNEVHEPKCDDNNGCTDNVCDTKNGSCSYPIKKGNCLINAVCISNGEKNPNNECEICSSSQNQRAYSFAPKGQSCDDKLYCTEASECNDSGRCVEKNKRDCGQEKYCDEKAGLCQNHVCAPAKTFCLGDKINTCNSIGNASVNNGSCGFGCTNYGGTVKCVKDVKISSVKATVLSDSSIKLDWLAVSTQTGKTTYDIHRSTHNILNFKSVSKQSSISFTDKGLTSDTLYYYRVYVVENGRSLHQYELAQEKTQKAAPKNLEKCSNDFCLIPSGSFKMGLSTTHDVEITYDFYMAQTETTQKQWRAVLGSNNNPSFFSACDVNGENCPVEKVSYWDALIYANEKSKSEGFEECYDLSSCTGDVRNGSFNSTFKCGANTTIIEAAKDFDGNGKKEAKDLFSCEGYRLPSEAEWEYAARATTTTKLYNGDLTQLGRDPNKKDSKLDLIAWYGANSEAKYSGGFDCASWYGTGKKCGTQVVAKKTKNLYGLFDMSGNVWEWVFDDYQSLSSSPAKDPISAGGAASRVRRGGSWEGLAENCRSGYRSAKDPGLRVDDAGFRLVRTAIKKSAALDRQSPIYPIAPSSQLSCYNAGTSKISCPKAGEDFYGQDGNYSLKNFVRFVDLKDGTIWDRVLKAYWQKCSSGYSYDEKTNNCTGSKKSKSLSESKTFCSNLKSLGNVEAWRLPDIHELQSLVDSEKTSGVLMDENFFPKAMDAAWSGTPTVVSGRLGSWFFDFTYGFAFSLATMSPNYPVKCLAKEAKPLTEQFSWEDQNNGIIIEKRSGLRVSKCPWGQTGLDCKGGSLIASQTWKEALKTCNNLQLGKRKWRLPSRHELSAFVDYKKSLPAASFASWRYEPSTSKWYDNRFWTATTQALKADTAWWVSFAEGFVHYEFNSSGSGGDSKASKFGVLCVSSPEAEEDKYPRAIEVASANSKECKTCSKWDDHKTCTQPSTCPKFGENGYGQEASMPLSSDLRFKDLADGSLLDLNTGRMWSKCLAGAKGLDCLGGGAVAKTFEEAKKHCDDLSLGGYMDWRLPHIKELQLIQDFSSISRPPLPKTAFKNHASSKNIWSSSQVNHKTDAGKMFSMNNFFNEPVTKTNSYFTLCTRGKPLTNNFKDNNDGTISDFKTRLMWQKCSAGQDKTSINCSTDGNSTSLNWKDALAYCKNLEISGLKDWRLPTIRELQSIVDYDKKSDTGPYIDPLFKSNFNSYYWSNTISAASAEQAWALQFINGTIQGYISVSYTGKARCVRSF